MNILFNPFKYIAGAQALGIGLISMAFTAGIAYYSKTHFDGTIDIHYTNEVYHFSLFIIQQLIAWGTVVLFFFLSGLLLSKSSIRFIDVAGTLALARIVLIPGAILGYLPFMHLDSLSKVTPMALMGSILVLLLAIWLIALMYNAFVVSCNLKGGKAIAGFIVGLLLAEALSKFLNYQLFLFYS